MRLRYAAPALLPLVGLCFTGQAANAADTAARVTTASGVVVGLVYPDHRAFLGIPYAKPPVGKLRWHAPLPAAPWATPLSAKQLGNECAQIEDTALSEPLTLTEDCLSLNVWTPTFPHNNDMPLPVMVWFHGGGFTDGASDHDNGYDGTALATRGNVVFVSVNYRLGVFGFLANPAFDTEDKYHQSGNYGFQDQQLALKWVKQNAAAFGGDPARVTIFGQSAGGAAVCDHLASPLSRGLFQRAIPESGGDCGGAPPTLAQAEQTGAGVVNLLNCTGATDVAACLRAQPPAAVLATVGVTGGYPATASPNTGSAVLPLAPLAAIQAGKFNKVPVMVGSTHDERTIFDVPLYATTPAQYPATLQSLLGLTADQTQQAVTEYPLSAYTTPVAALNAAGDDLAACTSAQAEPVLAAHTTVYAYEFNQTDVPNLYNVPLPPGYYLGAYHASEVPLVFQTEPIGGLTPPLLKLSDTLIQYWTRFAANGDPNNAAGQPKQAGKAPPFWPVFNAADQDRQELMANSATRTTYQQDHRCSFWASVLANP
jgi:para-nitrobenzyl esterase